MGDLAELAREELRREFYPMRRVKIELWKKGVPLAEYRKRIDDERRRKGVSSQAN